MILTVFLAAIGGAYVDRCMNSRHANSSVVSPSNFHRQKEKRENDFVGDYEDCDLDEWWNYDNSSVWLRNQNMNKQNQRSVYVISPEISSRSSAKSKSQITVSYRPALHQIDNSTTYKVKVKKQRF